MDRRKIVGATLIALSTLCEASDQENLFTPPPVLKRFRMPLQQVVPTAAAVAAVQSETLTRGGEIVQAAGRRRLSIVMPEGSISEDTVAKTPMVKDSCILCSHQKELAQMHKNALQAHTVSFSFPPSDSDNAFVKAGGAASSSSSAAAAVAAVALEDEDPLSLSSSTPMVDYPLRKRVSLAPMPKARVLSIDGGGVKALLQLDILARLERRTGLHTTQLFDMIGGTSCGAEIALLLTLKDPNTGGAKYTAEALRQILLEKFPVLFQTKGLINLGVMKEKYKITPIREMLRELAGTAKFGDALIPTFVTAFNISAGATKYDRLSVLASYTERDIHKSVVDAGLSSSAAPVIFKAHASEDGHTYLDGGLVANNPSLLAYSEARSYFAHSAEIVLVSLGAGKFESVTHYEGVHTGLASIGPELVSMFLEGQQSITQRTLARMEGVTSYRIDPLVEGGFIPLEDATPNTIRRLEVAANRWWEHEQGLIAEITARLERT